MEIKTQRIMLRKYENCFLGSDAVKWFMKSNVADTLVAAEYLGNRLVRCGLIVPLNGSVIFMFLMFFVCFLWFVWFL